MGSRKFLPSAAVTRLVWCALMGMLPILATAANVTDVIPPISHQELMSSSETGSGGGLTPYMRMLVGLSLLSLLPAALMAMTSFTRIVITLSFVRHALGLPETPPNAVLLTIGLFLTMFTMAPTLERVQSEAFTPFMDGKLNLREASVAASQPFKAFMARHVHEKDLDLVSELAKKPMPDKVEEADLYMLVPAFMLSELRIAFSVGFVIFLPFLLIDLIVSAILMSLGMMMMPPTTVALPLKLLLFVLIDGWSLIVRAIVGSYQ